MSKKTEAVEIQTDLVCTPHLLHKGDEAKVQCNQTTQTVASAPPKSPPEDIYEQLERVDYEDLHADSLRVIKYKLQFALPEEEDTASITSGESYYTRGEWDSVAPESEPKEGHQNQETQTRLMVLPHYLRRGEKASVMCDVCTQTAVTCEPECSISDIVPKLHTYLDHSSGHDVTLTAGDNAGDNVSNKSIMDVINDILNEVDNTHKHLFEEQPNQMTSSIMNERKWPGSMDLTGRSVYPVEMMEKELSCQTCEQNSVLKLRTQKLLNVKCFTDCQHPEIECKFENSNLFSDISFDQCVPCQEGGDEIGYLKLMKNICKDEAIPPVTIVSTEWHFGVPVVQQSEAETVIYRTQNKDYVAEVMNNDTTLIQTEEGDDVIIETETSYYLSTSYNQDETVGEKLTSKEKIAAFGDNNCCTDDCRRLSGSDEKKCQYCHCKGVKINLCIKNFGFTCEEDTNKIKLDLKLLPGLKKLEIKGKTKEDEENLPEEETCLQDCCPSKNGKKATCPFIIKRMGTGSKTYFVEEQRDCYCDMPDCSCCGDKKNGTGNEDETKNEEANNDKANTEEANNDEANNNKANNEEAKNDDTNNDKANNEEAKNDDTNNEKANNVEEKNNEANIVENNAVKNNDETKNDEANNVEANNDKTSNVENNGVKNNDEANNDKTSNVENNGVKNNDETNNKANNNEANNDKTSNVENNGIKNNDETNNDEANNDKTSNVENNGVKNNDETNNKTNNNKANKVEEMKEKGVEFCQKTSVKKKKSIDILNCRVMSICNLMGGAIMALVSRNKEGFDVIININSPTLKAAGEGIKSTQEETINCPCTASKPVPPTPIEKTRKCTCTTIDCRCDSSELGSTLTETKKCSCTTIDCRCDKSDSKSIHSELESATPIEKTTKCTCTTVDCRCDSSDRKSIHSGLGTETKSVKSEVGSTGSKTEQSQPGLPDGKSEQSVSKSIKSQPISPEGKSIKSELGSTDGRSEQSVSKSLKPPPNTPDSKSVKSEPGLPESISEQSEPLPPDGKSEKSVSKSVKSLPISPDSKSVKSEPGLPEGISEQSEPLPTDGKSEQSFSKSVKSPPISPDNKSVKSEPGLPEGISEQSEPLPPDGKSEKSVSKSVKSPPISPDNKSVKSEPGLPEDISEQSEPLLPDGKSEKSVSKSVKSPPISPDSKSIKSEPGLPEGVSELSEPIPPDGKSVQSEPVSPEGASIKSAPISPDSKTEQSEPLEKPKRCSCTYKYCKCNNPIPANKSIRESIGKSVKESITKQSISPDDKSEQSDKVSSAGKSVQLPVSTDGTIVQSVPISSDSKTEQSEPVPPLQKIRCSCTYKYCKCNNPIPVSKSVKESITKPTKESTTKPTTCGCQSPNPVSSEKLVPIEDQNMSIEKLVPSEDQNMSIEKLVPSEEQNILNRKLVPSENQNISNENCILTDITCKCSGDESISKPIKESKCIAKTCGCQSTDPDSSELLSSEDQNISNEKLVAKEEICQHSDKTCKCEKLVPCGDKNISNEKLVRGEDQNISNQKLVSGKETCQLSDKICTCEKLDPCKDQNISNQILVPSEDRNISKEKLVPSEETCQVSEKICTCEKLDPCKDQNISNQLLVPSEDQNISKEKMVPSEETCQVSEKICTCEKLDPCKDQNTSNQILVPSEDQNISKEKMVPSEETCQVSEKICTCEKLDPCKDQNISNQILVSSKDQNISKEKLVPSEETCQITEKTCKCSGDDELGTCKIKIEEPLENTSTCKPIKSSQKSVTICESGARILGLEVSSEEQNISKEKLVPSEETYQVSDKSCNCKKMIPYEDQNIPNQKLVPSEDQNISKEKLVSSEETYQVSDKSCNCKKFIPYEDQNIPTQKLVPSENQNISIEKLVPSEETCQVTEKTCKCSGHDQSTTCKIKTEEPLENTSTTCKPFKSTQKSISICESGARILGMDVPSEDQNISKQKLVLSEDQNISKEKLVPSEETYQGSDKICTCKKLVPYEDQNIPNQKLVPNEDQNISKEKLVPSEETCQVSDKICNCEKLVPCEDQNISNQKLVPSEDQNISNQKLVPSKDQNISKEKLVPSEETCQVSDKICNCEKLVPCKDQNISNQKLVPSEDQNTSNEKLPLENTSTICKPFQKSVTICESGARILGMGVPENFAEEGTSGTEKPEVPPLLLESPRSDTEYETCSEGPSPFLTPHCNPGDICNYCNPKTDDILLTSKEDTTAVGEPEKPSEETVEQPIRSSEQSRIPTLIRLSKGRFSKCSSCSKKYDQLSDEQKEFTSRCHASCGQKKVPATPNNSVVDTTTIEKKPEDDLEEQLKRTLECIQPTMTEEECPQRCTNVGFKDVPDPPVLVKVPTEYPPDLPVPVKEPTEYPPDLPLPVKVPTKYPPELPVPVKVPTEYPPDLPLPVNVPAAQPTDPPLPVKVSAAQPTDSDLPVNVPSEHPTDSSLPEKNPEHHISYAPDNIKIPSAHTMIRLPDNTVVKLRLSLDMFNGESGPSNKESTILPRKKDSGTKDTESSVTVQTGVEPFRTDKVFDIHKSRESLATVGFLKEVNPVLYSGSSKTVELFPTAESGVSIKSIIPDSLDIPTVRTSLKEKTPYKSTPNIYFDIAAAEKCIGSPEHLCKTSSKTSEKSSFSRKSKQELENKDVVFMAYKTCEEELKSSFNALNNIKLELKKLNMPEVDCIFKQTDLYTPISKNNSKSQERLRGKIKFSFVNSNISSATICQCNPQATRARFEVTNSPPRPRTTPQNQTKCRYKNPDFIDSRWSIPENTPKMSRKVHPKHVCCSPKVSSSKSSEADRLCCHRHARKNSSVRFAQKTDSTQSQPVYYTRKIPTTSKESTSHHYTKVNIKLCDSKVKNSTSTSTYQSHSKHKNGAYDSAYCSYPTTSSVYPTYSLSKQSVPESYCSHSLEKAIQSDRYSANSIRARASTSREDESTSSAVSSHVSSEEFVCPAKHKCKKAGKRRKHSRCSCSSVMSECPFLEAMKSVLFSGQFRGSRPRKRGRRHQH